MPRYGGGIIMGQCFDMTHDVCWCCGCGCDRFTLTLQAALVFVMTMLHVVVVIYVLVMMFSRDKHEPRPIPMPTTQVVSASRQPSRTSTSGQKKMAAASAAITETWGEPRAAKAASRIASQVASEPAIGGVAGVPATKPGVRKSSSVRGVTSLPVPASAPRHTVYANLPPPSDSKPDDTYLVPASTSRRSAAPQGDYLVPVTSKHSAVDDVYEPLIPTARGTRAPKPSTENLYESLHPISTSAARLEAPAVPVQTTASTVAVSENVYEPVRASGSKTRWRGGSEYQPLVQRASRTAIVDVPPPLPPRPPTRKPSSTKVPAGPSQLTADEPPLPQQSTIAIAGSVWPAKLKPAPSPPLAAPPPTQRPSMTRISAGAALPFRDDEPPARRLSTAGIAGGVWPTKLKSAPSPPLLPTPPTHVSTSTKIPAGASQLTADDQSFMPQQWPTKLKPAPSPPMLPHPTNIPAGPSRLNVDAPLLRQGSTTADTDIVWPTKLKAAPQPPAVDAPAPTPTSTAHPVAGRSPRFREQLRSVVTRAVAEQRRQAELAAHDVLDALTPAAASEHLPASAAQQASETAPRHRVVGRKVAEALKMVDRNRAGDVPGESMPVPGVVGPSTTAVPPPPPPPPAPPLPPSLLSPVPTSPPLRTQTKHHRAGPPSAGVVQAPRSTAFSGRHAADAQAPPVQSLKKPAPPLPPPAVPVQLPVPVDHATKYPAPTPPAAHPALSSTGHRRPAGITQAPPAPRKHKSSPLTPPSYPPAPVYPPPPPLPLPPPAPARSLPDHTTRPHDVPPPLVSALKKKSPAPPPPTTPPLLQVSQLFRRFAIVDWWPEVPSLLPLANEVENMDRRRIWA